MYPSRPPHVRTHTRSVPGPHPAIHHGATHRSLTTAPFPAPPPDVYSPKCYENTRVGTFAFCGEGPDIICTDTSNGAECSCDRNLLYDRDNKRCFGERVPRAFCNSSGGGKGPGTQPFIFRPGSMRVHCTRQRASPRTPQRTFVGVSVCSFLCGLRGYGRNSHRQLVNGRGRGAGLCEALTQPLHCVQVIACMRLCACRACGSVNAASRRVLHTLASDKEASLERLG